MAVYTKFNQNKIEKILTNYNLGKLNSFKSSLEPILWAQAYPLNATALRPCPGKQESPTQYKFLILVVLNGMGSRPNNFLFGIGP